jgi:hypothetical protein
MRRGLAGLTVGIAALVIVPFALAGAINSTTDPNQSVGAKTTGDCLRPASATPVNCNDYAQKQDVFLNGSPSKDVAGTYFFAVLVPGGQADPNDGTAKNLSDTTCAPYGDPCTGLTNTDGSAIPNGDSAVHREFSVAADGTITNLGNHAFDSGGNGGLGSLSVWPFDDTTNGGGVYILAVCKISDSQNTQAIAVPTVQGGDCKYDAFKVESGAIETASDLVVTKDATPAFTRTYGWQVGKSAESPTTQDIPNGSSATFNYTVTATHDSGTDSAWQVTGTIDVFNPNILDFEHVNVTDQIGYFDGTSDVPDPNASCDVTGGSDATIPALTTVQFSYTCTYLGGNPPAATDETNNATATWDPILTGDSGTAGFSFDFSFGDTPTALVDNCTDVTDTFDNGTPDDLGTVCADGTPDPSSLTSTLDNFSASYSAPTWTFTYSRTVSGKAGTCTDYDNTANFTTVDTDSSGTGASAEVTVCVGEDLGVNKTANTSYTRTYNWSISKQVDKTTVSTTASSATFNYTVGVNQTGFTDSAIQATGTITVSNPNDWESITLTGVLDSVDNGGTCSLTGGDSPTSTIPASGSVALNYTCTYSAPLPANGTNTATASWDATAASTPDDSAQGTADVKFGSPSSTTNKTITPTDAFNGGLGVNLCTLTSTPLLFCTLTATDSSPFASHTYLYHRTIAVTPNHCVSYSNIAATGTGATSGQTVTVCGPVAGGLTMGFWQNKNGQAIITGGASTAGVCKSGTWLRQYAPFQDLSSTATCSQVGTYVTNIIKAANASGSSMNAMLKAQMLATALDVYFSDPALGTNKIGAPAPLGGVKVDLTKVCKMIDGSSSSTCSGSYENASGAFGGAASLTVSQMLVYAASQSNAGGSTWYGNVKATQGLAKDAFDAINNGAAVVAP